MANKELNKLAVQEAIRPIDQQAEGTVSLEAGEIVIDTALRQEWFIHRLRQNRLSCVDVFSNVQNLDQVINELKPVIGDRGILRLISMAIAGEDRPGVVSSEASLDELSRKQVNIQRLVDREKFDKRTKRQLKSSLG